MNRQKQLLRIALLAAFVLSTPTGSRAQDDLAAQQPETRKQRLHLGLVFGPEITKLKVKLKDGSKVSADAKIGFHAGLAIGLDFGPLTVRSGVNFVNAGALFDGAQAFSRSELKVSFVTVPVDIRLRPLGNHLISPYIFAGPEFRYSLDLERRPLSLADDVHLFDATFAAGVGVTVRFPGIPFRFSPEVRYVNDLTGIYDGRLETDDGDFVETASAIKANAVRLGLLLGF